MGKNKMNRKKRQTICTLYKVFGIISSIVAVIFCISLFILNMLPIKYLLIIYILIFILYSVLLILTMLNKIKLNIKTVCIVFFIVFDVIFCLGIKYVSDTISFVDIIDNDMQQKEEYYVMTLSDFDGSNINSLKNDKIGVYSSLNSKSATDKLKEKINFENVEFTDVTEMFDDLEAREIMAILINGSIKTLLETDFKELGANLKELYKISVKIKEKDDIVKVVDVTRQPFNIYVAGGDAYGNIGNVTNTDVNMVITVDPVNRKLLLTSIPRDYYVNLPSFGDDAYDKLTHAGYYGIEESVSAVENLLDIDINYYVKVNFSTIEGVINAIGGVDVYVDYGFTDSDFMYTYVTGWNHMNGNMALRFARERKVFANGDVQRVKNQQKVLSAIIDKASSSSAIITNFSEILDSVGSSFSTNLDSKSISRLVKMQLNDMRGWSIDNQNLVGTDLYTTNTYTFPGTNLYVMEQDQKSIESVINKIKEFIK